jgi:hypothetical protein
MSANTYQHGGTHYVEQQIQPWDFIVSNDLGFLEGNIIKYLARYKLKNLENGGIDDLHKAYHYLTKLIEVTNERNRQNERLPQAPARKSLAVKHPTKQVRKKQVRRV